MVKFADVGFTIEVDLETFIDSFSPSETVIEVL